MSELQVQAPDAVQPRSRYLPAIGSRGYYVLLALVAIFILGPLGGIAAAYMNFSLGFFVGGQVLAGILGSAITYGYGAEGKHGANYMQTMAASVASMAGMAVLIQAMVWLGMEMPAAWKMILFFCCIGMFGVGLGMLYTPILVDRLQLIYPSGYAVANILRALTDKRLLKRSIGQLGGGTGLGLAFAWLAEKVAFAGQIGISASTIGAGMVVSSRIAVPGLVMGLVGWWLTPYLKSIHWLQANAPFRKIGFLIALAMILGAAVVDLTIIGFQAAAKIREKAAEKAPQDEWKQVRMGRLIAWVIFWGIALVVVATAVLHQPLGYTLFAIGLALVFVLINGISTGISDSNPISSAFVISILLMSALGLKSPLVGLIAASILLISCSVGVDMQQDRSTGWRLGTNRVIQFRYQVIGVLMGAVLCVVLARVFMEAYPVLRVNTFDDPEAKVGQWQSAMTFKFVGAIRGLGNLPGYQIKALLIGLGIGLGIEIARKLLRRNARYSAWVKKAGVGFAVGWVMDSIFLSSPYAASFGGFVELPVVLWYAAGGVLTSIVATAAARRARTRQADDLPEDMSTTSLVGGGLIAGESLYALASGVIGLLALLA
ncbi:MAG: OPT/YSL family transporter [Deltaproteobacteria bacterium]|nr:OPT/YSL family transporter [Deltaproteobacteria bacterium]